VIEEPGRMNVEVIIITYELKIPLHRISVW